MPSNPFPGNWQIKLWDPPGFLPEKTFKIDNILSIEEATPNVDCNVKWKDVDGQPCLMEKLPFDAQNIELAANLVSVTIGGESFLCNVCISLLQPLLPPTPGRRIKGCFVILGSGNTGTFIAEANNEIDGSA